MLGIRTVPDDQAAWRCDLMAGCARGAAGQQPPLPEPLRWPAVLYFRPAHQYLPVPPLGGSYRFFLSARTASRIEINGGGSFGVEFLTTRFEDRTSHDR
jgi:hypothetical protein